MDFTATTASGDSVTASGDSVANSNEEWAGTELSGPLPALTLVPDPDADVDPEPGFPVPEAAPGSIATEGDLVAVGTAWRPLTGHLMMSTHDLDDARAGLTQQVWPVSIRPVTDNGADQSVDWRFHSRLSRAPFGSTALMLLEFGAGEVAVTWQPNPDPAGLLVLIPWSGAIECWRGDDHVVATGARIAVIQPGRITVTRWSAGASALALWLPANLMGETLGHLCGTRHALPTFVLGQDMPGWVGMIHAMRQALDEGDLIDDPFASRWAQQVLAAGLLTSGRHSHAERLRSADSASGATEVRQIRSTIEWLHDHAHEPIGPLDLAVIAGVSRRELYRRWHAETGLSVGAYLRRVRLSRARDLLVAGRPGTTVTDVAHDCGFGSASRFISWYRLTYAEYPSETLSKYRRRRIPRQRGETGGLPR